MDQNTLNLLEYDKALEVLAGECHSWPGKAAALALQPNLTPEGILHNWDLIEEALELFNLAGSLDLSDHLDLTKILEPLKVDGAMLGVDELRAVGYEARVSKVARGYFLSHLAEAPKLAALAENLVALPLLVEAIERTIGPDGEILDTASPELARLRQEQTATRGGLSQKLTSLMRSDSFRHLVQDDIITTRQDRFVIPVRAGAAGGHRGLVHDWSKTGATAFLEPLEVVEDNNQLSLLKRKEKTEIERILRKLSVDCRDSSLELLASGEILTTLDRIMAQGRLAKKWQAVRPEYQPGEGLVLKEARHPLLAARLAEKGGRMTPLDIIVKPDKPIVIISGLNTGGKTVAMKTLGLNLLLAKAGLLISVDYHSHLDFPEEIIAVIGDEQDLSSDLSTFSGHVKSLNKVLEIARPGLLVLLDEIGSGTDPAEGAALGLAVLENLLPSGALVLAATHYQLIKTWAALTPGVESAAVNSTEKGQALYGLSYGSPGFSGGLKMARRLGLPESLIVKAESYLDEGQKRAMELLAKLDEERLGLHAEKLELENQRLLVSQREKELREAIQKRTEEFNRQAQKLDASIKDALVKAKYEFEALKKEMQEATKNQSSLNIPALSQKRAAFEKALRAARPQHLSLSEEKPLAEVAEGDEVFVKRLGRRAQVRSLNLEKKEAWVDAGGLNIKVSLDELFAPPKDDKKQKEKRSVTVTVSPAENTGLSINLLGQTVDEAIMNIEKEMDQAYRLHRKTLTIIHGFGTGRLRNGIRAFLKHNPKVVSFAPAPQKMGGEGVTIVELAD